MVSQSILFPITSWDETSLYCKTGYSAFALIPSMVACVEIISLEGQTNAVLFGELSLQSVLDRLILVKSDVKKC